MEFLGQKIALYTNSTTQPTERSCWDTGEGQGCMTAYTALPEPLCTARCYTNAEDSLIDALGRKYEGEGNSQRRKTQAKTSISKYLIK